MEAEVAFKILDFGAEWCGPCSKLVNIVNQLALDFPEYFFEQVDVDQDSELVKKYQVKKVPTLVICKNEKEIGRVVGLQPLKVYRNLLRNYLKGELK